MARATEEELNAALEIFNAGLARTEARMKAERAIEKAERTKQDAAATLKKLQNDPKATAEQKETADAAYRQALEAFNALRSGELVIEPEATEPELEAASAEPEPDTEPPAEAEPNAEPSAEAEPDADPVDEEPGTESPADEPEAAVDEEE